MRCPAFCSCIVFVFYLLLIMSIRILVVDDHHLVRSGLAMMLGVEPGWTVEQASDGQAAVQQVQSSPPDVVLMDVSMPGLDGMQACAQMLALFPALPVVMLSMHQESQFVRQALTLGARGYLLKDSAPQELLGAVRAVLRGELYLSAAMGKTLLNEHVQTLRTPEVVPDGITVRQREVLALIAKGFTSKQIAQQLNLSAKTVDSHRTNLMNQLGIHDLAGLVRFAVRTGLVSVDH